MIYIATTNYSKYKSLKRTLHLISKDIEAKSIFHKKLDPPRETGKDESEDALIKARYYSEKIKGNVLCEDDKININIKERNGKIRVEPISFNAKEKIARLKQYLNRHKVTDGTMVKVIVGCNNKNNSYFLEKIEIPVKFIYMHNKIYNNRSNMLNYFMAPKGFLNTFSKMGEINKQKFSKKYLKPPLARILEKLGYK